MNMIDRYLPVITKCKYEQGREINFHENKCELMNLIGGYLPVITKRKYEQEKGINFCRNKCKLMSNNFLIWHYVI